MSQIAQIRRGGRLTPGGPPNRPQHVARHRLHLGQRDVRRPPSPRRSCGHNRAAPETEPPDTRGPSLTMCPALRALASCAWPTGPTCERVAASWVAITSPSSDIQKALKPADSIARGYYPIDLHRDGEVGIIQAVYLSAGDWYGIPYRLHRVRRMWTTCSWQAAASPSSHEALGSTRISPVSMALGQAAGVAAGLCIRPGSVAGRPGSRRGADGTAETRSPYLDVT